MKRFVLITLCVAMLCIAGCGGKAEKSLDVAAFASAAVEKMDFGDELMAVPEQMLSDYYTLPKGKVSEYAVYVSGTGATASELAVFKCSSDAVKDVEAAVKTRIEEQIASYANYRPDEKFRLEKALLVTEGDYVVFAVSNDNEAVEKLLGSSMK